MVTIERLKKESYNELLDLYNLVFTRKNGRLMNFEKELPLIWVKDDSYFNRHFAIREDGKLVSAVGVYPINIEIMGEKLRFVNIGNVATHPSYEGKGYMKTLMAKAMEYIQSEGIDCIRLGGLRQRYNNYGFDACGQTINFTLTERNINLRLSNVEKNVEFREVRIDDEKEIKKIIQLNKGKVTISYDGENEIRDTFLALTVWQNRVYTAYKDGNLIGYISVFQSGNQLGKIVSIDNSSFLSILVSWQNYVKRELHFSIAPWEKEKINSLYPIVEGCYTSAPSLFKVLNYEKLISSLLKLKASYSKIANGEFVINIEDYGNILIKVDGENILCEKTNKKPNISLNCFDALRFLFGPLNPEYFGEGINNGWFPLPLSWNTQDSM